MSEISSARPHPGPCLPDVTAAVCPSLPTYSYIHRSYSTYVVLHVRGRLRGGRPLDGCGETVPCGGCMFPVMHGAQENV